MSYIDKLKIPKGLLKYTLFQKISKGVYSIKIRNPEPTSLDDLYIELLTIDAKNQYEAKEKLKGLVKTDKELNRRVTTILKKLKEIKEIEDTKRIERYIKTSSPMIYFISTTAIRKYLQKEGFDTTNMTREEMIELLKSLSPKYKEPVYVISTKRFKEYTPEGTQIIYEKQELSDGTTKTVKIKEILPPNWTVYRNKDGIIDSIETEIELLSGMWKINISGIDEHPDILDDREYLTNEIKRVEYKLYSDGKDPTYISISGGTKPWDKKTKQWSITARLLPETEAGGGLKPPAIII